MITNVLFPERSSACGTSCGRKRGSSRRPGLDEAHDITTIEVSSRTNGLRFFLYALLLSFVHCLLLRRGKLNHRGWKVTRQSKKMHRASSRDMHWCFPMMFVDFLIRFLFVLMPQNVDPSSFQNTPLQWGKMNEWCTKWNAHPGLFCHALSSTILRTNAWYKYHKYHFIGRFVKTKIFTLCNVCPQKYTVYRHDMVAACNGVCLLRIMMMRYCFFLAELWYNWALKILPTKYKLSMQ